MGFQEPGHVQEMQSGKFMDAMFPFWYAGAPEYDQLCQSFQDVVRKAGKGELKESQWESTVDGKMAQIVLCDQLSRNAFRGQEEAFAYDEKAMEIARDMSNGLLKQQSAKGEEITLPNLEGEVYLPYLQFIVSPLMHSELPHDHELALEVADYSVQLAPEHLKETFEGTKNFELEHKKVIDRFGRYPHRNKSMGRESTPEELEWLSNEDELPGWAKSQG